LLPRSNVYNCYHKRNGTAVKLRTVMYVASEWRVFIVGTFVFQTKENYEVLNDMNL
jgi:hypothetical protein